MTTEPVVENKTSFSQSFLCFWKTLFCFLKSLYRLGVLRNRYNIQLRCIVMGSMTLISVMMAVLLFRAVSNKVNFTNELRFITGISGNIVETLKTERAVCEAERKKPNTACVVKFVLVDHELKP